MKNKRVFSPSNIILSDVDCDITYVRVNKTDSGSLIGVVIQPNEEKNEIIKAAFDVVYIQIDRH